jgi:hypothetical protein
MERGSLDSFATPPSPPFVHYDLHLQSVARKKIWHSRNHYGLQIINDFYRKLCSFLECPFLNHLLVDARKLEGRPAYP